MGRGKKPNNQAGMDGDVTDSVVVTGSGNTVNIHKDSNKKRNIGRNKLTRNGCMIAMGVLIVGIFLISTIFAKFYPTNLSKTQTPTLTLTLIPSPIPTDTTLPGEPASTPISPTDTPTLTPTPIPSVPLGEDWMKGCISTIWSAYPESVIPVERGDGCWREPVHAFSAENGDLDFLFERQNGDEETYGLFAPLPIERGSVTLTIRLKDLNNADLLVGIFSRPEVKSQGLLMSLLHGDVNRTVFIQRDPFNYVPILGTQKLDQGNGYSITFGFDNLSVRSVVNPSVFVVDSLSLPSSQKYLFVGYKGLRGYYRIEGTFLNFDLNP